MPPPARAHTTATTASQQRQVRLARARHSLDNTGISIDSSELPSELIADYSVDEVLRLREVADTARREAEVEQLYNEDEEGDLDAEDADLGKRNP